MTDKDIETLTSAAARVNRSITEMISLDMYETPAMLTLLTAASGCFTTLVHIASLLTEMRADQAVHGTVEGFMRGEYE